MNTKPILFQGAMVRALLDGSKTQTRRIVKPWKGAEPSNNPVPADLSYLPDFTCYRSTCPYGRPGDQLWVREAFHRIHDDETMEFVRYGYRADSDWNGAVWKPSIHMPRAASRIALEITGVRVERLQDISESDARAEGCSASGWTPSYSNPDNAGIDSGKSATEDYAELWEQINGSGSWNANPWVWVVEFKRVK